MSTEAPTSEDFARLEARVHKLEAALAAGAAVPPSSEPASTDATDADTFWALEGAQQRYESPGAVLMVGHVTLPDGMHAAWQQGRLTSDILDDAWEDAADALSALGHPVRLRILQHIAHGTATAKELTQVDGLGTTGQVYHHLRQLSAAGWLHSQSGRYQIRPERLIPLLTSILGGTR